MDIGIFKRTTFIVADAKEAASFYVNVFGWSIWYDNKLKADYRFPPTGAPDQSEVHLVIVEAIDPKIGKLGFLQYLDPPFEVVPPEKRSKLTLGDSILVIESEDINGVYERAVEHGALVITKPVDWYVPSPNGEGSIHLRTVSLFDPNGIYMEVSDHPSRNK